MDFELIAGVYAIPVILGIVELVKLFNIDPKYCPIIAVILGQVFGFALAYFGDAIQYQAAIQGLVVGLGAVGLYSGVKNTAEIKDRF